MADVELIGPFHVAGDFVVSGSSVFRETTLTTSANAAARVQQLSGAGAFRLDRHAHLLLTGMVVFPESFSIETIPAGNVYVSGDMVLRSLSRPEEA